VARNTTRNRFNGFLVGKTGRNKFHYVPSAPFCPFLTPSKLTTLAFAMKTCGYCGRENQEQSPSCFECGTHFSETATLPQLPPRFKIGITAILTSWPAILCLLHNWPQPVFRAGVHSNIGHHIFYPYAYFVIALSHSYYVVFPLLAVLQIAFYGGWMARGWLANRLLRTLGLILLAHIAAIIAAELLLNILRLCRVL
jgi:hypothetical protein